MFRSVGEINQASADTVVGRLGITFLEASVHRITATMPAEGNKQPQGVVHGAAFVVLAESLGSLGAALYAGRGRLAVAVDVNATYHRAVRSGLVTGVATPLFLGRSLATYEVIVTDESWERVCSSRITCVIQGRGSPSNGGSADERDSNVPSLPVGRGELGIHPPVRRSGR
jgi:1,4-dihydroxy-2-naphthoyl-CoA hydrolase